MTTAVSELGTRDRLVAVTGELMRRQGYAATGVKAILAASGAPSGSLYHFFPGGKEQLAAEAVRVSGGAYRELVESYFAPGVSLRSATKAFFNDGADLLESTDFVDACPIAAIALETAGNSPAIQQAAAAAFESWQAVIRLRAIEAGASAKAADSLAEDLFMLVQGAFLLCRTTRDAAPMRRARRAAVSLVDQLG